MSWPQFLSENNSTSALEKDLVFVRFFYFPVTSCYSAQIPTFRTLQKNRGMADEKLE